MVALLLVVRYILPTLDDWWNGPDDKGQKPLTNETKVVKLEEFRAGKIIVTSIVKLGEHEDDGIWAKVVPGICDANSSTIEAKGTVESVIEFKPGDTDKVTITPGSKAVHLELPAPEPRPVTLDAEDIVVIKEDKGVCTKVFSNSDDDRKAVRRLKKQLTVDAAARLDELRRVAEDSARAHYTRILNAAGIDDVTVTFAPPRKAAE